jgi:hypothetical protein
MLLIFAGEGEWGGGGGDLTNEFLSERAFLALTQTQKQTQDFGEKRT